MEFRSVILIWIAFLLVPVTVGAAMPGPSIAPRLVKTILFLGDSITAGYGVKKEEAFPAQVGKILKSNGRSVKVINGGISGSVAADADRRLKWFLRVHPEILVLELGANDALKGTPPQVIEKNLAAVIDFAQREKIKVLLCGVEVFSNFGADYTTRFKRVFRDLAKRKKVPLLQFSLKEIALKKNLMQADGKHPNAKGHAVVAKLVARQVEKLL